jgi:hypothetical protein
VEDLHHALFQHLQKQQSWHHARHGVLIVAPETKQITLVLDMMSVNGKLRREMAQTMLLLSKIIVSLLDTLTLLIMLIELVR